MHYAVTLKVKSDGYNVTDEVTCLAHNSTTKSRSSTQNGRKVLHATADILNQFQGQKVKGQGHQVALCYD